MSWIKNSPVRHSPPKEADPSACYDSFCKHWEQCHQIIKKSQFSVAHDDVLAVVNHIDQMITLLLLEFRNNIGSNQQQLTANSQSSCLEYLLSENLLDLLYNWTKSTGRYINTIRLEQMRLFEVLILYNRSILAHEPVSRPLLRLLDDCTIDLPVDLEKKLIVLLNGLCVALMQNIILLDVFFQPNADSKHKFIIFSLLLPHVHREGDVGQQARDAMLLCMALSKKHPQIGNFIAHESNVCPFLATGISGLYSLLPRKLDIETDDWHRLTPDDVNDIPALDHLMQYFEFCNAVAQIAHPSVQKQLLDYLYQGFLVLVMAPALFQTSVDELVAATAYIDLFLRSATNPGLLQALIRFILEEKYDGSKILESLIRRISTRSRLCIVTLALFETLVDLNCEDVMLELCLSALLPCSHVMLSQRCRLRDCDIFGITAKKFLSLRPICCLPVSEIHYLSRQKITNEVSKSPLTFNFGSNQSESLYGNYHAYLFDARQKIITCRLGCTFWSSMYTGCPDNFDTIGSNNVVEYSESIKSFSERDILESIKSMMEEDEKMNMMNSELRNVSTSADGDDTTDNANVDIHSQSLDHDIQMLLNEQVTFNKMEQLNITSDIISDDKKTDQSLFSMGESSGYESLAIKNLLDVSDNEDNDDNNNSNINNDSENDNNEELSSLAKQCDKKYNNVESKSELTDINDNHDSKLSVETFLNEKMNQAIFESEKPDIGMFLNVIFKKLESMTSNNLYVNLHLTGLISRLAIYPQPLLQSFLLNPSLVFQPSIRSLFQILATLKNRIDQYLIKVDNVEELVHQAKMFLINRETRLVNVKRNASKSSVQNKKDSLPESLSKNESKRRSITSSLTQIFKFTTNSPPNSVRSQEDSLDSVEYTNKWFSQVSLQKISPTQHVVICAVILDEWLKELAAITQEHVILSFSPMNITK